MSSSGRRGLIDDDDGDDDC